MTISNEQWDSIVKDLTYLPYSRIEFKYQEHEIAVIKINVSATKSGFSVYIDGVIKGEWTHPDKATFNPLVKLFWDHNNRKMFGTKKLRELEKIWGKKEAKQIFNNRYTARYNYYYPTFTSLNKLINKFKKIEGLELAGGDL